MSNEAPERIYILPPVTEHCDSDYVGTESWADECVQYVRGDLYEAERALHHVNEALRVESNKREADLQRDNERLSQIVFGNVHDEAEVARVGQQISKALECGDLSGAMKYLSDAQKDIRAETEQDYKTLTTDLACGQCSHIFPDGKEVHFHNCPLLIGRS